MIAGAPLATKVSDDALRRFIIRCKRDPDFFVRIMLGETPHPGQKAWLEQARAYINVLRPGNRYGKSYVEGFRHLWHAWLKVGVPFVSKEQWLKEPYETISLAVSDDQARIVYRLIQRFLKAPAIAPFVAADRASPFPHIKLLNGSVIHVRSLAEAGKYVDGHSYRYMSVDEAGWIPDLKEIVTNVLLMRLAGGGMLDLIGTPKGIGSGLYWYWNRASRGVDGYFGQRGSVFDNPYLPVEDIQKRDELLAHADPRIREQVIYGEFVATDGLAFTQDELENAFMNRLPAHQDPVPGHIYYQAWDLGRKTDFTVGVTFDVSRGFCLYHSAEKGERVEHDWPFDMVDFQRLNQVGWETIYTLIDDKAKLYGVAMPRIDATGPQGDVIVEELWKRGIPVDDYRVSNGVIKTNLVNALQASFSHGRKVTGERESLDEAGLLHLIPDLQPAGENWGLIRMPSIPQLLDEFGQYSVADDRTLVQDCVMAVALAVQGFYADGLLPAPISGSIYGDD